MSLNLQEKISLSPNAIKVLEKRYLKRGSDGAPVETPQDMFFRVASTLASADKSFGATDDEIKKTTEEFYSYITNRYFMPNSPTLMNAGRELGQLAACFVLPVEDSLEGIFETVKNTALIHKSGGGTGFSFSRLRPKNDVVRSTMGVSSGPVSFMEVFNAATEAVKQGGTRRGANMGILRVDHPDILDFINCKSDNNKLNNFNISVAITDEFMEALKEGRNYNLIHPNTKKPVGSMNAKAVFDLIVEGAWKNGEPGIVFIDKMNYDNPTPNIGAIESTNPCGEVPLLPYEACNLGSINLGLMIKDENGKKVVDWDRLKDTTKMAIHFLDNVIVINNYPLPQIDEMVTNNRKIGLGVMGWADMLMQMELSYSSPEGTKLASQVMEFIDYHSKVQSIEFAKSRGKFNNFEGSIYDGQNFLYNKYKGKSAGIITDDMWADLDEQIEKFGIRNATTTCIAPTGTISMIASASGGVEPLFGLVFMRDVMDGTRMPEVNPTFEKYAKQHNFYSTALMEKISEDGTLAHCDNVSDKAKTIFVAAHDVTPEWHVKMQAAFQLHTDNAVSKTVNFVESATREDVAESYMLAYDNNLKGITVYRNNSRQFQPMNLEKKADDNMPKVEEVVSQENQEGKEHRCPECGKVLGYGEGCFICLECGYSGCS
ncbi:MAG: adenosylcobalamin-dependent ribonucleoside-diphosphate reductase [Candidatus Gastranaerophilales bacterium]|nr:adenosylcobalamin-dependent ribonucleoside-diphosphate reductase [Candidatus Gastranaerophilales bacterium]